MSDREIPGSGYDSETRNKILDVATELFALKGSGAVSMRDIAKMVGIKMASIYYYYDGKDALMDDILSCFEHGYRHYFAWLTSMNEKAESLEEVMANMFNKEFVEMLNPIGCLGMSLALKEQHHNESARKRVFDLFYAYSIRHLKASFDRLIEKGLIPPSDTETVATLFMLCILSGNDIRIHEYAGVHTPIHCTKMYGSLKTFLTTALRNGNPNTVTHDKANNE